MLIRNFDPKQIRAQFRHKLASGELLKLPGAFSPFVAQLITELGFDGVYISGAGLSNDLGFPDVGLTTLTEVSQRGAAIARQVPLPTLIDIDTGFGEAMSVARCISELEMLGLSGCHLEDQMNPKRCGHLDNKSLVETSAMVQKIQAAARAKQDSNFLIMARTDARASEGLEQAIERAKAYVAAGADAIFPEALTDEREFEAFRKAVSVPLLANMTEFGKSKLLTTKQLEALGFNMVIYPMTAWRLAMKAIEDGLRDLKSQGTQEGLVPKMQTRARLYEVLKYADYSTFDQQVFNFKLKG